MAAESGWCWTGNAKPHFFSLQTLSHFQPFRDLLSSTFSRYLSFAVTCSRTKLFTCSIITWSTLITIDPFWSTKKHLSETIHLLKDNVDSHPYPCRHLKLGNQPTWHNIFSNHNKQRRRLQSWCRHGNNECHMFSTMQIAHSLNNSSTTRRRSKSLLVVSFCSVNFDFF